MFLDVNESTLAGSRQRANVIYIPWPAHRRNVRETSALT